MPKKQRHGGLTTRHVHLIKAPPFGCRIGTKRGPPDFKNSGKLPPLLFHFGVRRAGDTSPH
jgi:hypothetical protein